MRILKVISMSYKALVKLCKILSMLKLTGDTLASVLLGKEARSLCIASAEAQSKRIVSCDLNAVHNPGSRVASAPGAAKSKAFPVVGWTSTMKELLRKKMFSNEQKIFIVKGKVGSLPSHQLLGFLASITSTRDSNPDLPAPRPVALPRGHRVGSCCI